MAEFIGAYIRYPATMLLGLLDISDSETRYVVSCIPFNKPAYLSLEIMPTDSRLQKTGPSGKSWLIKFLSPIGLAIASLVTTYHICTS